jgi:UDP-2,3-diacylglucosamine pyrophosphatase LpxH
MSVHLPLYEDLYVVSDLHLGGTKGSPIFRSGENLAALIKHLAYTYPTHGGQRALILNGDVIDSLAEVIDHYVASPNAAETMLADIMDHPDFEMVWSALADFVSKKKHRLVICIGNHDLELAYPNVQEQIVMRLGGEENESIRGRILFSTMGIGHLCRVGSGEKSARVRCVHGNEYDKWNAISPENMARLVRSSCLGVESKIADDPPNAGTHLVIDVMNKIKEKYPFVDLLKPEVETVFNILLALDPATKKELPNVLRLGAEAETQGALRVIRVLGESAGEAAPASTASPDWKPGGMFGAFLGEAPSSSNLLEEAWDLSSSEIPTEDEQPDELLGLWQSARIKFKYWFNRISKDRVEALRCALLDWIGDDKTWNLDGPDKVCDELEKLEPDVDVVIAGHTHLRRQMEVPRQAPDAPIKTPSYLYLNTGTWARLMKLDEELLENPEDFLGFCETLKKQSMEEMDKDRRLVQMHTVGVVRLNETGNTVEAALCEKNNAKIEAPELIKDVKDWQEVEIHG